MAGQFIHIVHLCELPDKAKLGIGTIWKCECDKEYTLWETSAHGYYKGWDWSNRPPIIKHHTPSKWQLFKDRFIGKWLKKQSQ